MISSREAQRTNHGTFTFSLPDPTEIDDAYLFAAAPPPQMRPDSERRPVHTDSILCKTCRSALEFFAYIMEESRSSRSQASVVAHHRNLYSLRDSVHLNSHFCVFLASQFDGIRIKESLFEISHSNHQIELCWAFEPGAIDDQRFPGHARINLALTNSTIERTSRSYPNFIRLQL